MCTLHKSQKKASYISMLLHHKGPQTNVVLRHRVLVYLCVVSSHRIKYMCVVS